MQYCFSSKDLKIVILDNKMLFSLKQQTTIKRNEFLDFACNLVILGKAPLVITPPDLFVYVDVFMLPNFSTTKVTIIGESDVLIHPDFIIFELHFPNNILPYQISLEQVEMHNRNIEHLDTSLLGMQYEMKIADVISQAAKRSIEISDGESSGQTKRERKRRTFEIRESEFKKAGINGLMDRVQLPFNEITQDGTRQKIERILKSVENSAAAKKEMSAI